MLALVLVVAAVSCSDDDGAEDSSSETTTSAATVTQPSEDTTTTASDSGAELGTVEVDGETYSLTAVTGITSCDFDDPSGSFSVAAESDESTADGGVFVRLDLYGDDPDSNEFSVAVGEVEYVSASPEDVVVELDEPTVSGTVAVEPLFEEGTAQDVTFEITCPS